MSATFTPLEADWELPAAPNLYPNASEGFLLDEDNALRQHLMGLKVYDDSGRPRQAKVWFSHPDPEIREQEYPYIVISLIDITEATDRVMSGYFDKVAPVAAFPAEALPPNAYLKDKKFYIPETDHPLEFWGRPPMPVQIDYQVRMFSRHPRHSRVLLADMLGYRLPYRYGVLDMGYIDGSARRMHLLDIGHAESIETNKRLFVSSFTIRVDSFMPSGDVLVIMRVPVTKVLGVIRGHAPDWFTPDYKDEWEHNAPVHLPEKPPIKKKGSYV